MDRLMTILTWLEATPLAAVMRQSPWSYPLVETAHILGFILLIGAAAMFDQRLLGLAPRLPVVDVARHLLPWSHVGLAIVVISGALLSVATWNCFAPTPWPAKAAAGLSLMLWITIAALGRFIAYIE